jgi:hypothetical protein
VNELSSKSALKHAAGCANVKNVKLVKMEVRINLNGFIGAFLVVSVLLTHEFKAKLHQMKKKQ